MEGSLEGSVEGSLDGSVEGSVEGSLEGSVEGSLEGLVEGSVEGSPGSPPPPPPSCTVPVAHRLATSQSAEREEAGRHRARASDPTRGKEPGPGLPGPGGWSGWFASVGSPSPSSSGGRNARIHFASGGGAGGMRPAVVIDDPATDGDDVVVGTGNDVRLASRHARPLEGPRKILCRASGGGGDAVLRSENRCKIRIFTILYTQAVDN